MSTGQVIGGVVGAAAGFVIGGPTGALYGAQIGMMAGGYLDPPKGPTQEGPRLSDLTVQTSTYGAVIPRAYGTVAINGNVFWLENNKLKETVKKKKTGGKGGGSSTTVKTYSYSATFAVELCQGPIAGVKRIWVGPDLVYDSSSSDPGTSFMSGKNRVKFSIYLGTDTQLPDSRMQAEMGAANCPAYRGIAYIVFKDLPLEKYGKSLAGAQVKVEVQTSQTVAAAVAQDIVQPNAGSANFYKMNMSHVDDQGVAHIFKEEFYYRQHLTGQMEQVRRIFVDGDLTSILPIAGDAPYVAGIINSKPGKHVISNENGVIIAEIGDSRIINGLSQTLGSYYVQGNRCTVYALEGVYSRVLGFDLGHGEYTIVEVLYESSSVSGDRIDNVYPAGDGYFCSTEDNLLQYRDSSFSVVWSHDLYALFGKTGGNGWGGGYNFALRAIDTETCIYASAGLSEIYIATATSCVSLANASTSAGWSAYSYAGIGGRAVVGKTYFAFSPENGASLTTMLRQIDLGRTSSSQVDIGDIVEAEILRSGLLGALDIDVDDLSQLIDGYKIASTGSLRNGIEPLRAAYPFDLIQSGYKIKGVPRGSASVATIPHGEIVGQLSDAFEMESQLPAKLSIKYLDKSRGYDTNEQIVRRDGTQSVNRLSLDLPIVLTATESARAADVLMRLYLLERTTHSFTLPPTYAHLEPGDAVTLAMDYGDIESRLTDVNYKSDGTVECKGRASAPAVYDSIAEGDDGQSDDPTIPVYGASTGYIIDCAVLDESVQDSPGFLVAAHGYTDAWPGGTVYRSGEGGSWDDMASFAAPVTAGISLGTLAAHDGRMIQSGATLSLQLYSGELESVTESEMLNGANVLAYGAPGRWEILRFMDATLELDGTITIGAFWRGDRGTEWATGLHEIGDRVVLLTDVDIDFAAVNQDMIGVPRDYRAITSGADIDSATSQTLTYTGENLRPLSGVDAVGVRASGDLTITWTRRTRTGGGWRDYVDASIGETTEAYSIDVMNGSTVVRTLTATTPSAAYSSADQTTDFGSPQSSVTVRIYQLSSVVGRGYVLEATL